MSATHDFGESLCVNSRDRYEAPAVGPRSIDQIHFVECQLTALHNPSHLALFRQQSLFECIGSLRFRPGPLLQNLVSLLRIGRIPGTPNAGEFGRAHIAHGACSTDDLGQRADFSLSIADQFCNFIRTAPHFGGQIDAIDKERFRRGYYLIRSWLRIVFRHARIALVKYSRDHFDWHALICQLCSEGVPKDMRGELNGLPVSGLKAETMEQQPHHTVQGSLCNAMSSPLENKSIGRYLAPVGPDDWDFHITTLVDLKTE
jgi:hypothetical protein